MEKEILYYSVEIEKEEQIKPSYEYPGEYTEPTKSNIPPYSGKKGITLLYLSNSNGFIHVEKISYSGYGGNSESKVYFRGTKSYLPIYGIGFSVPN